MTISKEKDTKALPYTDIHCHTQTYSLSLHQPQKLKPTDHNFILGFL